MARMTKAQKQIENQADAAFQQHGSNIQFNIFDLRRIRNAGIKAGVKGESVEAAVIAAIAQYRKS